MAGAKLEEIRILDTFRSPARRRLGTLVVPSGEVPDRSTGPGRPRPISGLVVAW
jgi:hypothetical protein